MGDAVTAPLVELRGAAAAYGSIAVLDGVDLALRPGTVTAALGPNGAGKTTIVRVLSGELAPTAGDLLVGNRRMNGATVSDLARAGLCTVPEGRGVFPNLSVAENLWMVTHRGVDRSTVEQIAFDRFPQLARRRTQLAGTMSGGEQQMLALARAIATRPAVLLVDELSMGLAPLVVKELFDVIARLAADGVAVLLVEQFADEALHLADHAVIVAQGRIAAAGTPDQIRTELRDAYLGVGPNHQETP